jgi:hypothetical protein
MLDACAAADIVPVVLLIPPRHNSASGTRRVRSRDTVNAALAALVESYDGIAVDADPYVGKNRIVQLLSEPDFATHALWNVAGDWNDSGGNAAYAHATGVGTLTQASASLQEVLVAGEVYKLTYTVATPTGDAKATVRNSGGPATVDTDLTMAAGTHSTFFTAKAVPGDFVLHGTSTSGGFTLDNLVLEKVGEPANYWDIRAEFDHGDHLHYSTEGYRRIAEAIIAEIATLSVLGEVACGQLRTEGPIRFSGARGLRSLEVERTPDTSRAGAGLTIRAGGAAVDAIDRGGGTLKLCGGLATGSGKSAINLQVAVPGTSGSADVTPTDAVVVADDYVTFYDSAGVAQMRLDRADGHLHFWSSAGNWTQGMSGGSTALLSFKSGIYLPGQLQTSYAGAHLCQRTNGASNDITSLVDWRSAFTGNGSANNGASIQFTGKDAAGNQDAAGHVGARLVVVTSGSEVGELVLSPTKGSAAGISATRALLVRGDASDATIAHVSMPGDNALLLLGAGEDCSISYNGTDMLINPKKVGTGILSVTGVVRAEGYQSSDGTAGWTGTFTEHTGKTVTVKNGLVTACA